MNLLGGLFLIFLGCIAIVLAVYVVAMEYCWGRPWADRYIRRVNTGFNIGFQVVAWLFVACVVFLLFYGAYDVMTRAG